MIQNTGLSYSSLQHIESWSKHTPSTFIGVPLGWISFVHYNVINNNHIWKGWGLATLVNSPLPAEWPYIEDSATIVRHSLEIYNNHILGEVCESNPDAEQSNTVYMWRDFSTDSQYNTWTQGLAIWVMVTLFCQNIPASLGSRRRGMWYIN